MKELKITNHQLFTVTALSTLGGSILVISAAMATIVKQDAWLSILINIGYGWVMISIYSYLGSQHPGLTLVGIIRQIFGKWLGLILAVCYVLFFIKLAFEIPWFIGSFHSHQLVETPPAFINVFFYVALVIAVLYGIEAFSRASEIFYVFVTALFIISIILVVPNAKFEYIEPVLEKGLKPVFKGSIIIAGYISFPVISMLMIFPKHIEDMKKGKQALLKGFLWANVVVLVTILISTLVLGSIVVSKSSFPTVNLAEEIVIGTVLTRLEYIITVMWTVSEFGIGILNFYCAIVGFSELLGLNDHKKIVLPMGLVGFLYADTAWPNSIEQANYVNVWLPHIIVFGAILPFIMLFVFLLKNIFKEHRKMV